MIRVKDRVWVKVRVSVGVRVSLCLGLGEIVLKVDGIIGVTISSHFAPWLIYILFR